MFVVAPVFILHFEFGQPHKNNRCKCPDTKDFGPFTCALFHTTLTAHTSSMLLYFCLGGTLTLAKF